MAKIWLPAMVLGARSLFKLQIWFGLGVDSIDISIRIAVQKIAKESSKLRLWKVNGLQKFGIVTSQKEVTTWSCSTGLPLLLWKLPTFSKNYWKFHHSESWRLKQCTLHRCFPLKRNGRWSSCPCTFSVQVLQVDGGGELCTLLSFPYISPQLTLLPLNTPSSRKKPTQR